MVLPLLWHNLSAYMGIHNERLSQTTFLPSWVKKEHAARYAFAASFSKNSVVVDCACGSGEGSYLFAQTAQAVYGFDISKEALAEATQRLSQKNLHLSYGSAYAIPLPDNFADVVISLETIEHLEDEHRYLQEMKRILREGGTFICSTPNRFITNPGKNISQKPANIFHVREYSSREFQAILAQYFPEVEMYGHNPYSNIRSTFISALGRVVPGHLSTRVHQFLKLLSSMVKQDQYYNVRKIPSRNTCEFLVAVCKK